MEKIYLDHCATTPMDPAVMAAMMKYFGNFFGNPGSIHSYGKDAKKAIDHARDQVAALLGANPDEIIFTGGGTEADNLAIMGLCRVAAEKTHIITSAIEHHAVLNTCKYMESLGFAVTYVPVDHEGRINPADVEKAITENTALISIIHGNNEIGVIEPLPMICAIAQEHGIPVHTDAVQTVGKLPFDVQDVPVDSLSLAGHKIYGPKGTGALYIRRGTNISPQSYGGPQERGFRAGTENVPGIVGLGMACELAMRNMAEHMEHTKTLRDLMEDKIKKTISGIRVNGGNAERLPHVLSVSFRGVSGDELIRQLDDEGIAVSAGAACHADILSLSHVLEAIEAPPDYALGTIRISTGKDNTIEDIDRTADVLFRLVTTLREKTIIE